MDSNAQDDPSFNTPEEKWCFHTVYKAYLHSIGGNNYSATLEHMADKHVAQGHFYSLNEGKPSTVILLIPQDQTVHPLVMPRGTAQTLLSFLSISCLFHSGFRNKEKG